MAEKKPDPRSATKRPWRTLFKVLGRSTTTPVNLGVAGTAAIAAAAVASWPIAAIGGLAYGALVAWDVANPDFWKRTLNRSSPSAMLGTEDGVSKMPDPRRIRDPGLADAVRGILGARKNLEATLAETPEEVRANLAGALFQVGELERLTTLMVTRGEDVAAYLAKLDPKKLAQEIATLYDKVGRTRDAEAKAEYEKAKAAKLDEERSLAEIRNTYDRIMAKLTLVSATLESLPAKIVRMRALDAQARDALSGSVNDELSQMSGEVQLFEETLESMAEVPSL